MDQLPAERRPEILKSKCCAEEREAQDKKRAKAEKKQQKETNLKRLGVTKPTKKTRKGGIRIRKGVTVKVHSTSIVCILYKPQIEVFHQQPQIDLYGASTFVILSGLSRSSHICACQMAISPSSGM